MRFIQIHRQNFNLKVNVTDEITFKFKTKVYQKRKMLILANQHLHICIAEETKTKKKQIRITLFNVQLVTSTLMEEKSKLFKDWSATALIFSVLWSIGGCLPLDSRIRFEEHSSIYF